MVKNGREEEEDDDEEEEREATMENGKELSEEQRFASKEVPSWKAQLTPRSLFVSTAIGFTFSFVVMKLNVTTGVVPSLNVAAGLLGFFFIKVWTSLLSKFGFHSAPFTRQENTVIQTCVVATSGIAFSSGFASYILAMTDRIAIQADSGNKPVNLKPLSLGWMIGFTLVVSFIGPFSIVPLRKIMILNFKLTYPSGTATANLINSFHTPAGNKLAKKQVLSLFRWFGISFSWAFFQWFYTSSEGCGFKHFPTFGLQAYKYRFFFDFSSTYIGVGMLCPHDVNFSMLFGSVVSWGIMWPLIQKQSGHWYPANLSKSDLRSLQGYKVFIAISMILGDGLFHFVIVLSKTLYNLAKTYSQYRSNRDSFNVKPISGDTESTDDADANSYDDERRAQFFMKDQIPLTWALSGYVALAAVSTVVVPQIFDQLEWYQVLITYIVAPVLAFCNSYGCGLTDWSFASSYGKIAILIIGAWVGDNGGVVAGLAACGVMMSIVSTGSDLMQDFKTAYLTLASPRSMFFSQLYGTLVGCIVSPLVFWFFFYKAYTKIGQPDSAYPAPYGLLYRGIALIGVRGISALPKNCLNLSLGFFLGSIALNIVKEVLKHKNLKAHIYIPSAMVMAIPFYLGGYFTIDMCIGSLVKFIWEKKNKVEARGFGPAVASGLICGDSLWGLPAAILSLVNVNPPMCMKFLSKGVNDKVDAFLNS